MVQQVIILKVEPLKNNHKGQNGFVVKVPPVRVDYNSLSQLVSMGNPVQSGFNITAYHS